MMMLRKVVAPKSKRIFVVSICVCVCEEFSS